MNIEAKAKRYAESVVDVDTFLLCLGKDICDDHIAYASQCYTAGYTQAVTDLNVENEKLREALRELIALSEAESKDDIIQYEMDYNTELSYENSLAKAKQLIENRQDKKHHNDE